MYLWCVLFLPFLYRLHHLSVSLPGKHRYGNGSHPSITLTEQEEQDMLVAQRAQEEEEAAAREDTEQVIRREQSDAELARKTLESLDKDRKQQKASDAAMAHNDVVLEFHTELQSAPAFPAPPPPRDFPPAVMAGSLPAGDDSSDAGGFEEGSDSEMA